jgi:hypothetical protein
MRIHQLLPCLLEGDAIGNHVLALKRLLQAWGHSSEIYAQDIAPRLKDEARPLSAYKPSAKSITLYALLELARPARFRLSQHHARHVL